MTLPSLSQKMIVGTVQFGLHYGISNSKGQVSREEVCQILTHAHAKGVTTLDTAAAYGESEEAIGFALRETGLSFNIISKLPPVKSVGEVRRELEKSMVKLGVQKLEGYLLHHFSIYKNTPLVVQELLKLQEEGLIGSIGFSLYHPKEVQEILDQLVPCQLVQFPYNLFDRRFDQVLDKLKDQQIETHVRSIFLQGLFFMNPSELGIHFSGVKDKIASLQHMARRMKIPLHTLLLSFVAAQPNIDKFVIGIDSLESLRKNLEGFLPASQIQETAAALAPYTVEDEDILLPFNWKF
ncbi:aldo/keto reductase [Pontibacter sp. 13R65]|uniref:aldo/keto reductase n=1 Tax=Pontibacter sp. 13R65 TaxID=3127458 RepID=UPI00301C9B44